MAEEWDPVTGLRIVRPDDSRYQVVANEPDDGSPPEGADGPELIGPAGDNPAPGSPDQYGGSAASAEPESVE